MTRSLAHRATTWRRSGFSIAIALAIVAIGALITLSADQQPAPAPGRVTLTAQDYIDIQQLVRKYAWALDGGDNYGYAYADLFTPDGVFVGTNQGPDGRSYQGREALAALARTPAGGPNNQRHFTMNHVIAGAPSQGAVPTATGRVYVVMLDVGMVGKPNAVSHGGHYEDIYGKTSVGWRFKRRAYWESKVDIWPK